MLAGPWRSQRLMVGCLKAVLRLVTHHNSLAGDLAQGTLQALTSRGLAALPQTVHLDDYLVSIANRVTRAGVVDDAVIAAILPRRWKDARGDVRLSRAVMHAFEAYMLAGEITAAYAFVANATAAATAAVVDSGHVLRPGHLKGLVRPRRRRSVG